MSERAMTKIKRISAKDKKISIEIHQSKDGYFALQKYVQKYDSEEDVFYEVRMRPDPSSLFGDIESATEEARLLLGLE